MFFINQIYKNASVFNTKDVSIEVKQMEETFDLAADTIITSIGYAENDRLFTDLENLGIPVHNIGDSSKVHNIMYAIWDSYELAKNL